MPDESDASGGAAEAAPAPEPDQSPSRSERVSSAVDVWRRELAAVGGANTLLWHRDRPEGTLDLTTAHPGGVAMLLAGRPTRLSDLVREPVALQDARQRVRRIRHKMVELWEEHGLSTGYIAVGMATWDVPRSPRPPAAPVLLRSCALRPTSPAELDFDVDLGADVEFNPVLAHYLRSEQGLSLDTADLADRSLVRKGFDPHPVYAELSRLCRRVPGFRISPRLVVGTFSHDKLPMVADLGELGDDLVDHEVVAALAGDSDARGALAGSVSDRPDDPDPREELAVLDLDPAQQSAVEAVRAGASLVVEGASGTGRSQTIAATIAALAGEGKRVLFVAEKRAAIDAVRRRLDRAGLGDLLVADPGSAPAWRRVLGALAREVEAPPPTEGVLDDDCDRLVELRSELVGHQSCLHDVRDPWHVSAFDAQVALATFARGAEPPASRVRVTGPALERLTRDRVAELGERLSEAAELGAWAGDGEDPWYASRLASDDEASRALDITTRLSGGELAAARDQVDALMAEAGIPSPATITEWHERLRLMEQVRDTLEVFRLEVFEAPLTELVAATARRGQAPPGSPDLGVLARARLTRQARALLRPGSPPADLHAELVQALAERDQWRELAGSGSRPDAPADVEQARETFAAIRTDIDWLGARLESTAAGNDLVDLPLDRLRDRLRVLADTAERLEVVPRVLAILDEAREAGLGDVVDDLAERKVPATQVPDELEFVWWASVLAHVAAQDPRYGEHDGDRLRSLAADYAVADRGHLESTAARVRAGVGERLREATDRHTDQVEALAEETRRARGLRDLWADASDVLTAVRPCWAMSPLMVASLLPPGRWFDVVVVDGTGQVPTSHLLSALARGTQLVVVGDRREVAAPPFVTVATDSPDSAVRADSEAAPESAVRAAADVLPVVTLGHRYAPGIAGLVEFARRLYDDEFVAFPSALGNHGIRTRAVGGSDDGPTGATPAEPSGTTPPGNGGDALVQAAARALLDQVREHPTETVGLVTTSSESARSVEVALARQLEGGVPAAVAEAFRPGRAQRAFVKPLERAQGDTRDAVVLLLDRAGSLDRSRAALAATLPQRRLTVVLPAGLLPADTEGEDGPDTTDHTSDFLRHGATPVPTTTRVEESEDADKHPVVVDLAARLRDEGFVVHVSFGSRGGSPIDLAIEDPSARGRLLVAIETDGRERNAIRSTRMRERIGPEQLERFGWHHVRVWTTDVFRDPARVVAMVTGEVWAASRDRTDPRPSAGTS